MTARQRALPLPKRIEIIQMADPRGCFEVWCDLVDGTVEGLDPEPGTGVPSELSTIEHFPSLRTAVAAAAARWPSTPLVLARWRHVHDEPLDLGVTPPR